MDEQTVISDDLKVKLETVYDGIWMPTYSVQNIGLALWDMLCSYADSAITHRTTVPSDNNSHALHLHRL